MSKNFNIEKDVKQRDILSSLLFVILIDQIINKYKTKTRPFTIDKYRLTPMKTFELVYADDIMLITSTKTELRRTDNENKYY